MNITTLNSSGRFNATMQIIGLENVSFNITEFALPSISLPTPEISTPFSNIPLHSDKPVFDDLSITYIVDEHLKNWLSLYHTAIGHSYPIEYENRCNIAMPHETDAYIHIYNSKNRNILSVKFHNVILTNVGEMSFTTTDNSSSGLTMTSTATFKYSYYTIENQSLTKNGGSLSC